MPSLVTSAFLTTAVQNGGGACGNRNSLSGADELAVQFGDNKTDSLSSAGGVRNDVSSASSCSSEVALAVRTVQDHLVAGVSVDGGHDTALDRSIIIKSLSHRSQAVGGAGSSRDDGIILGKGLLINAENDGRKIVACRSGNNNLLSAGIDMSLALFLRAVEAGALQNYVNTDFAPRKILSVLLGINLKNLAIYSDGACFIVSGNSVSVLTNLSAVAALSGIILEKVSEHLEGLVRSLIATIS